MSSPPKRSTEYRVEDREILLNVFKRYLWNPIVPLIPAWIAPNAITVFATLCSLAAVPCALAGVSGHLGYWWATAALLFIYTSADNLDGAHARRTGQTSKTGEILDHGLDGLSTGAFFYVASIILTDDPRWRAFVVIIGVLGYSITFWEQLHRGVLIIPSLGAVEASVVVGGAAIMMGILNNPQWARVTGEWNLGMVFVGVIVVGFFVDFCTPLFRTLRAGAPALQYLPMMVVTLLLAAQTLNGTPDVLVVAAMSLGGATVTFRMIHIRLSGVEKPLVGWLHAASVVPVVLAMVVPQHVGPIMGGVIALVLVFAEFITDLLKGIAFARREVPISA